MSRKSIKHCEHCGKEIHFITHNGKTKAFEKQVTRFVPTGMGDASSTGYYASKNGYIVFYGKPDRQGREGFREHYCIGGQMKKAAASANA